MMRLVKFFVVVVILISVEQAFAEGGSSYTFFGVGDLLGARDARAFALGGASFARWGGQGMNVANPATWSELPQTTLDIGYAFQYLHEHDATGEGAYNTSRVRSVFFVAPAWHDEGLAIGFGLQPVSEVNYSVFKTEMVGNNVSATTHYIGGGGLSMATIGASIKVIEPIALAVTGNYIYGTIRDNINTLFSSPEYTPTIIERSESYGAFQPMVSFVARPLNGFTLGGTYSFIANGTVTRNETHYALNSALDTTLTADSTMSLPQSFGAGVAYSFGRMMFAFDYWSEAWSASKIFGATPAGIRDASRFSFGVERAMSNDVKLNFLDRIALRMGAHLENSYVSIGGDGLSAFFASAGVGIPVTRGSTVDIGLEFGMRGRSSGAGVKENIFRLAVSLSASEAWFAPSRDDE